jgi:hypothetical protein
MGTRNEVLDANVISLVWDLNKEKHVQSCWRILNTVMLIVLKQKKGFQFQLNFSETNGKYAMSWCRYHH